jgi:hypothetical protein
MNIQRITNLLCIMMLVSCVSKPDIITDFPIKPDLKTYSKPPVLKKIDNDFLVTAELIYNTTMLKDYNKRIESWKDSRNIR